MDGIIDAKDLFLGSLHWREWNFSEDDVSQMQRSWHRRGGRKIYVWDRTVSLEDQPSGPPVGTVDVPVSLTNANEMIWADVFFPPAIENEFYEVSMGPARTGSLTTYYLVTSRELYEDPGILIGIGWRVEHPWGDPYLCYDGGDILIVEVTVTPKGDPPYPDVDIPLRLMQTTIRGVSRNIPAYSADGILSVVP